MNIIPALEERFGAHRVRTMLNPIHSSQELTILYLELNVPITIVMTNGLSNYTMPVSEKWKGRQHTELFFALPTYWDLEDVQNTNFSWPFDWIFRLESFVRERNTWFGPGHTIPTSTPPIAISNTMKQDHFIFLDPIYLESALAPLEIDNKTVHFLATVPIFADELDYKMGRGTHQLVKKMIHRKMDERIDDYRVSMLRSRMRFW